MHKSIGFIDYFLDEWHANNYPTWLKEASNGAITVDYAYGAIDSPLGGRTTDQWCSDMGIQKCASIEELIEKSDYIIVLSPDNPEQHWDLCQLPLRCGKRVYVDKTFAPTAQIARDLVALAKENKTPMFSTSALRFAKERMELPEKEAELIVLTGPGQPGHYLIHPLEPMVAVLKERAVEMMYNKTEGSANYTVCFESGKLGYAHLLGDGNFAATVKYADGTVASYGNATEMFERLMQVMLHFFETGEVGVDENETVWIAEILEAAQFAEENPGCWVEV